MALFRKEFINEMLDISFSCDYKSPGIKDSRAFYF